MHHFSYRGDVLTCEGVSLSALAAEVGTPCYVYSTETLRRHAQVFIDALSPAPHLVCFSVKANSSWAVLATLARLGLGADIVSGGELFRALRAGIPGQRIVFSGAGKQAREIVQALEAGILQFNVESEAELELIDRVAGELGRRAPIALRVNPAVDPQTHPYIATGLSESKFGIPVAEAQEVYRRARRLAHVEITGIDCHIGSQLVTVAPFLDALAHLLQMVAALRREGIAIRYLDIGGGLGIRYDEETPPTPAEYGARLRQMVTDALGDGVTLICEPGRAIVGNAGVLLTQVLFRKRNGEKRFVIVDAAMNDLIRPSLYEAYHAIQPVVRREGAARETVDVVGPICESGDFLAQARVLPEVHPGDFLAVMSAGAYGFSMASTYNSRPRPAEIMVQGEKFAIVRQRETHEELIRGEALPAWLVP